jgi:hypothetical protein
MHIREATEADVAGIAKIHVDTWRTNYAGIVPDEHLAGLSYEGCEASWRRRLAEPDPNGFIYVAEKDISCHRHI